eukprot:RCo046501
MMRLRTLWGDRLHRQALHYAMTSFSASVLNNVFVTFYVQTFLTTFHLNQFWFMVGQVVYCVWNCTNDPVFGWIGDTRFQNAQQRRLPRIRVGGPLWALAFLVVWCPFTRDPVANPAIAGLHFIVAMVLYDGGEPPPTPASSEGPPGPGLQPSLSSFVSSIGRHRNFWVFVGMAVMQQFSCTFNTNFFALFLAFLGSGVGSVNSSSSPSTLTSTGSAPGSSASPASSVVLLSAFVLPHMCTIWITALLPRFGKHAVVRTILLGRLALAVATSVAVCSWMAIPLATLWGVGSLPWAPGESREGSGPLALR